MIFEKVRDIEKSTRELKFRIQSNIYFSPSFDNMAANNNSIFHGAVSFLISFCEICSSRNDVIIHKIHVYNKELDGRGKLVLFNIFTILERERERAAAKAKPR